ncbi:MAG: hypothetical protein M9911_00980 [Saprospiraceae bacterium]|nr:hypothetical protein [Saprospiraceae bacterium]
MKKEDVPQDNELIYENKFGSGLIKYAVDEKGEYTTVQSIGWEIEAIALKQALEEVDYKVAFALKEVSEGRKSPIFYFMEKKLLDVGILAGYMNMWKWQVKRHFSPKVFNKLNNVILSKYAQVFDIEVDDLLNFKQP